MQVFLSYSHTDATTADTIASVLSAVGVTYFRDVKDMHWGDQVNHSVREAIEDSTAVIVIISPGSLKSQWVPYEIGYASALRKRILPFLTHPAIDPPHYAAGLLYVSDTAEIRKFFEDPRVLAAEAVPKSDPLTGAEMKALAILSEDRSVEIGDLSSRLQRSMAATDEMMNRLKRLDLVTSRYSSNGGKFWELDFQGERLVSGKDTLYLIEERIRNG